MGITKKAQEYHEKMFPGYKSKFLETDPEFIERFDNFAFDEVVNEEGMELDQKTRMTCILAVLLGCQGIDEFKAMLPAALNAFGTCSSSATIPISKQCMEDEMGVSDKITSIAIPLGATVNMDAVSILMSFMIVFFNTQSIGN